MDNAKRSTALGRQEFYDFLFGKCVPKIKSLTKKMETLQNDKKKSKKISNSKKNKLKEEIEKITERGISLIETIYFSYPVYKKDIKPNLAKELEKCFSEKEMRFFRILFLKFKETEKYKELLKTEESKDYLGECYESAYTFMLKNNHLFEDLNLIQGWVYNPELDQYMGHAWNETKDIVYDWTQTKESIPKNEYYNTRQIHTKGILKYTYDEAISQGDKLGHYGPWNTDFFDKELLTTGEFQARLFP